MAQTKDGAVKAAATIKEKHGADYYARIGAIGGRNGNTGGTYGRPDHAKKIGKIGGKISKRGYKFVRESEKGLEYIDKATGKVVVYGHDGTLENHKRSTEV